MIVERSLSLAGIVHGNLMHADGYNKPWQHLLYERHAMLAFVFCVRQRVGVTDALKRAVVFGLMGDTDPLIRLKRRKNGCYIFANTILQELLRLDGLREIYRCCSKVSMSKTLFPQCSVKNINA
jgi:hypothetical protein